MKTRGQSKGIHFFCTLSNEMISRCSQLGITENARQVIDKTPKRDTISWKTMLPGYLRNRNGRIENAGHEMLAEKDVVSWTKMIVGFARNGQLEQASNVFDKMPERNVVTWNAMLAAYVRNGKLEDSQKVFDKMPERNVVSWNTMIAGYAQTGRMEDARQLFDKMPKRDVVSWTSVITGYAKNGCFQDSLDLFSCMHEGVVYRNQFTFTSVFSACASLEVLLPGKQVHADSIKMGFQSEISVGNAEINMYAKCGSIHDARQLFDTMPERDVVSWTSMIAGYAQNEHWKDALELFAWMLRTGTIPNQSNLTCVLGICTSLAVLEDGKQIHTHTVKTGFVSNVNVGNVLVSMYAKCGEIDDACLFFEKMCERNVLSWNSMIVGYAENGRTDEARQFFDEMPERNVDSWNVMIVGYARNKKTCDARVLFEKMPEQNVISWTAVLTGYVQNGQDEEALQLFSRMGQSCVKPNHSTWAVVLSSCAGLATLEQGKQVHAQIIKTGFESDVFVRSAIVDMYAKCGNLDDARLSFDKVYKPDTVLWTAIISAYAQHGHGREALLLFEQMQQAGLTPNHVTFLGVLAACSHSGLVDKGWHYFFSMNQYHGIRPRAEHYVCMVDILGRSGRLDEAEYLINSIPYEPDAILWKALLGACRIHGNLDIGKRAAEHLFDLEPQNAAAYVLLSNIYAAAGKWEDVAKVRRMMKDREVKKNPGCSWIEIKNVVHKFLVGDRSHPQSDRIYAMLDHLAKRMKEAGYLPDTGFVLPDVEEQQK